MLVQGRASVAIQRCNSVLEVCRCYNDILPCRNYSCDMDVSGDLISVIVTHKAKVNMFIKAPTNPMDFAELEVTYIEMKHHAKCM
ncbi:hypothetical protein J6590_024129 [Homalodisca vitripennis]|nr:hypothetical protein J6590_024129 [Homalodisca vitripennis]